MRGEGGALTDLRAQSAAALAVGSGGCSMRGEGGGFD